MLEVVQYYMDDPRARIDARERLGRAARRIRWTLWTCTLCCWRLHARCGGPAMNLPQRHRLDTCQAAGSQPLHIALVPGTAQCMPRVYHQQKGREHGTFTSKLTEKSTPCADPSRPALMPSRQSPTRRRRKRRSGGRKHALKPQKRQRRLPRYRIFTLCSVLL